MCIRDNSNHVSAQKSILFQETFSFYLTLESHTSSILNKILLKLQNWSEDVKLKSESNSHSFLFIRQKSYPQNDKK